MEALINILLMLLAIVGGYLIWKAFHIRRKLTRYAETFTYITPKEDGSGFSYFVGHTKKRHNRYLWQQVKQIQFRGERDIVIQTKSTSLPLKYSITIGYYSFLKAIPQGIDGFDYDRREAIFEDFNFCVICGHKARDKDECHNCGQPYGEATYEDVKSSAETLKQEQLEYFADLDDDGSVSWNYHYPAFDKNTAYHILVMEDEVLKYREEAYD